MKNKAVLIHFLYGYDNNSSSINPPSNQNKSNQVKSSNQAYLSKSSQVKQSGVFKQYYSYSYGYCFSLFFPYHTITCTIGGGGAFKDKFVPYSDLIFCSSPHGSPESSSADVPSSLSSLVQNLSSSRVISPMSLFLKSRFTASRLHNVRTCRDIGRQRIYLIQSKQ